MGLKENIKFFRQRCNLTLEEVSQKLEVSKPTLQRYESGVISNIPYDKVERLAEIFGITPSELMGWNKIEKRISKDLAFNKYLESIDYSIEFHQDVFEWHNENVIKDGKVITQAQVSDNETFTVTITKNEISTTMTEAEFEEFQETIKKSVEFEIFKASQK